MQILPTRRLSKFESRCHSHRNEIGETSAVIEVGKLCRKVADFLLEKVERGRVFSGGGGPRIFQTWHLRLRRMNVPRSPRRLTPECPAKNFDAIIIGAAAAAARVNVGRAH